MRITTSYGAVEGVEVDGIGAFKGIPFARAARFEAPVPVEPWSGVLDATSFGAACPQGASARAGGGSSLFGGLFGPGDCEMSEDCLNLNIYAPATATSGPALPVLVWIHGGIFRMGTAGTSAYDGSTLARRGQVVVVTLNYRLGVLGFSYLPGVGVANAGLRDQVAALEWVHREIAAFGGDPHNITIFGESAGGKSVECLLTIPSARGLFHRAIAQSTYGLGMTPDAAEATTRGVLGELGIADDEADRIRDVPIDDLLGAASAQMAARMGAGGGLSSGATGSGGPIVDGEFLPREPLEAIADGVAADIPLIVGTTLEEARLFGAMMPGARDLDEAGLLERVAPLVPDAAAAVAAYRSALGADRAPADVWFSFLTDRMFRQHCIELAETQSQQQRGTYMYLFTWAAAAMDGALGSCHALELPFVFGTMDSPLGMLAASGGATEALAERVQDAWLAFARTGEPGPDWPPYDPDRRATAVLGATGATEDAPLDPIRAYWSTLP